MLLVRTSRRWGFFALLGTLFIVFAIVLGGVLYFGDKSIAAERSQTDADLKKLDEKLASIKARKAAEKRAAEAAAKQKAAADAALSAQQAGQVVTPAGCAIKGAHGNPNSIDVIINKKHCFSPIDFVPSDLTSFNGYLLSAKIVPDLTTLFEAASAAGVPLSMTSSYRSYANQVETYNHWVRTNGSTAAADTVSARPGYSEHQTGFAFDLSAGSCSLECFRGSAQYMWMQTNAANYGFVERYPEGLTAVTGYSPEAWHWRYVGKASALEMKAKGIKTLEQLWNISGGGY